MITLALFIAQSRTTNPRFHPEMLYLGTVIIDISICDALVKVFGA